LRKNRNFLFINLNFVFSRITSSDSYFAKKSSRFSEFSAGGQLTNKWPLRESIGSTDKELRINPRLYTEVKTKERLSIIRGLIIAKEKKVAEIDARLFDFCKTSFHLICITIQEKAMMLQLSTATS
jgi:hypothetical protein